MDAGREVVIGGDREGIGRWLAVPWAMVAVLFLAVSALPEEACGRGRFGWGEGHVAFIALAGGAIGAVLLGAGYRVFRVWQGRRVRPLEALGAVGVGVAAVAIDLGLGHRLGDQLLALAAGFIVALACYLALVIAFAEGRRAADVRLLLPVGLILTAAFVGIPFIELVVRLNETAIC
jgi:hypothetical protein